MKITVASQDLKAAFKVVNCAVGSEGEDIQTHFVFRTSDDGKVEILAYSQRIFARTSLVCTVDGDPVSFTARAKDIQKWVKALPDEALVLEYVPGSGNMVARSSNATAPFASLDPAVFPYWDNDLKGAKEVAEVPADAYRDALVFARGFTSKDDTQQPQLCVIRVLDGICLATDQASVVKVTIPSLKGVDATPHTKFLKSLVDFLGVMGTKTVKVLNHPRMSVYVGPNGELYGESSSGVIFPSLAIDGSIPDLNWWEFDIKLMKGALEALSATAKDDEKGLKLRLDPGSNKILLSMNARVSGESKYEIPCLAFGKEADCDQYAEPFIVSREHFISILGLFPDNKGHLGINYPKTLKSGWIRHRKVETGTDGEREFLAISLWTM